MLTGDTPYKYDQLRESEDLVKEMRIPRNMDISDNAKEVIRGLLEPDVTKRWGYEQIRKAAWFKPIDFESIAVKNLETPWKPSTKRPNVDGSHALDELISKHEKPRVLTSVEQELFRGWDYNPDNKDKDTLLDIDLSGSSESVTKTSKSKTSDVDKNQFFDTPDNNNNVQASNSGAESKKKKKIQKKKNKNININIKKEMKINQRLMLFQMISIITKMIITKIIITKKEIL